MSGERIRVRDVDYYVERIGEGTPILLLHGFTGSSQVWRSIAQHARDTYEWIGVDLLGHGRSDAPEEASRYAMEEATADLAMLMRLLGHTSYGCVGYSMGGRVALSLACERPSEIRFLVLESASPGLKTMAEREERMRSDEALAKQLESGGLTAFIDSWERIPLFVNHAALSEEVQVFQRSVRMSHTVRGLAGSLRGLGTGSQPPCWEALSLLDMPILLVTGERDDKFRRIAVEMQSQMRSAAHCTVVNAGHAVHVENPAGFERCIWSFMEQCAADGGLPFTSPLRDEVSDD